MILVRIFLFLAISAVGALAGSTCPQREGIYPCMCINTKLQNRKQVHTTVVCRGLATTEELNAILPFVKDLNIDEFIIYDSFWEAAQQLGAAGDSQSSLPNDWLTLTNIKEVEIIDSTLSPCFACKWTLICRNTITTSFKVVNSTSSDKICTICDTGRSNRLPWMGCMSNLESFQLSHGGLKSLTREFFPLSLDKLKTLNLSYNQISKIDSNVFRNVPNIKSLDLSHNAIEHINHTFGRRTELVYLDLSYNTIKQIGSDLIYLMPKIKSLNFAFNQITNLTESDWRRVPDSIRDIDLRGNSIRCDCNIRFVNSTFDVGVHILGNCAGPDEFQESRIRPASRNLIERCNAAGAIGQRKKKPK